MSNAPDKQLGLRETGGSLKPRDRKNFLGRGKMPPRAEDKERLRLSGRLDSLSKVWGEGGGEGQQSHWTQGGLSGVLSSEACGFDYLHFALMVGLPPHSKLGLCSYVHPSPVPSLGLPHSPTHPPCFSEQGQSAFPWRPPTFSSL